MSQLPPPNRIPLNEWIEQASDFFSKHNLYGTIEADQTTIMFNLHNDRLLPRETGRSCSACRGRVFNNLKAHYEMLIKNTTSE